MAAIYTIHNQQIRRPHLLQAGRMDTNDTLRLASLWHSMHAISSQLSPVSGCTGLELLEADNFDLHCFQSLTDGNFFGNSSSTDDRSGIFVFHEVVTVRDISGADKFAHFTIKLGHCCSPAKKI